jgi:predicted metalloprotease
MLAFAPLAAAGASVAAAQPTQPTQPTQPVRVTARDIAASNQKVGLAYGALVDMWTSEFQSIGARFIAPEIARYSGAVRTPCGVLQSNNAQYCAATNTIYYDEVFVAGMAKIAGASLGTDGDMTSIGIIAHEMGHAVAMELGHRYRTSYDNEATADCLAGAFAKQAQHDGSLEDGDLQEAMLGMSMAGDPTLVSTGDARYDRVMQARLARDSHGTREQRVENFRAGLDAGAGACLDEFASVRATR